MCNFRLQINKTFHIRHFRYTGRTAASRIGFWYSYSSVRERSFRKLQLAHAADLWLRSSK